MSIFNYANAKFCRVCESTDQLFSLTLDTNKNVLKKLRACADIAIDLNDELPKELCRTCADALDQAYKFKIKCEYTDQKLRDRILELKQNSKIDFDSIHDHSETEEEVVEDVKIAALESVIEDIENEPHEELHQQHIPEPEDAITFEKIENENADDSGGSLASIEDSIVEEHLDKQDENDTKPTIFELDGVAFEDYSHLIVEGSDDDDEAGDTEETYLLEQTIIKDEHAESDNEDIHEVVKKPSIDDEGSIEMLQDEEDENLEDCGEYYEGDVFEEPEDDEDEFTEKLDAYQTCAKTKRFICDTCKEPFTNFTEFNLHKKSHGNQRYQCPICSRWFSKRYHMKNHQSIHEGQKLFNCMMCAKRYTNQGNLDRHVRVFHNQEKAHVCHVCGKGFSQSTILRQHYSVHIEERNFECNICQKRYKTQEYLNLHKHRHLPPEQRRIKVYPSAKTYKAAKKILFCSYCGKKSNSVALHSSHMRTHTGEKPFECYECKKKFSFQQSLKSHILLHTGEKPYKCDDCNMTFRQIGHLKGHKLTHTGLKQHLCTICSKAFALRGNLTVHMRLHTGETPYHCRMCSKQFYDSNGLKRHIQVHTKNKDALNAPNKNRHHFIHKEDEPVLIATMYEQDESGETAQQEFTESNDNKTDILVDLSRHYRIDGTNIYIDTECENEDADDVAVDEKGISSSNATSIVGII